MVNKLFEVLFEKLFHTKEIEYLKRQVGHLKRENASLFKKFDDRDEKEKTLDTVESNSTTSYNGLSVYPRYIFNLYKDGSLVIKHQHSEISTTGFLQKKDVSLLLTLLEYHKDIIEKK